MENKIKQNTNHNSNRNRKKIITMCIVLVLSLGAMAGFAIALVLNIYTIGQGQDFYTDLSVEFRPRDTQATQALQNPIPTQDSIGFLANEEADEDGQGQEGYVSEEYMLEESAFFIDFDAMQEIFPDIVGWIQSEGTVINYPIVQGLNNDFYLYHLPDGSRHVMGSIFLDYRNSPYFTDQSIIIYGHDMRSGDMFGSLRHYANQLYFEQHSSMFIFTPNQEYKLVLFAGYILDSAFEVPPMSFNDAEDFERFISNIKKRSIFTSDVEVNFGDRLMFLATCVASGSINDRLIIVGKLEAV